MLVYQDHAAVVDALAFSPDGATLVSGDRGGGLVVRDADGAARLSEHGTPGPAVHAVAFLPDGGLVVGHARGWHVHRHAAADWPTVGSPVAAPTTAVGVIDARLLAVGTGDRLKPTAGKLEIWDVAAGRRLEPHYDEPNGVRAVSVCPAKKLVAWATGHKQIKVWDIRKNAPHAYPQMYNCPALALRPDGTQLAAGVDWAVMLFDLHARRERLVLKGHKGQASAVAFSPDGTTVASGSWDQTVRLWDAATGRELANFKWPIGKVYSLAFAPDGLRLAAGGELGGVVVWDLE